MDVPSSDTGKYAPLEAARMSVLTAAGYAVIVVVHTVIAVVLTRFFRLQLSTWWGAGVYTVLFVPLALLVSTVVLSGLFRLGGGVGGRDVALTLVIATPLALGIAIDLFWMPAPDEVELPEST